MASPIQRLGSVPTHRLAAPAPSINPMDPTANNPQMPAWVPTGGQTWGELHPSEQARMKEINSLLDDQQSFFVSIGHGIDGLDVIKGMFGKLDASLAAHKKRNPAFDPNRPAGKTNKEFLTAALPIHKPAEMDDDDFNTCRFGVPVQDIGHLENMLIGGVPTDLLMMAHFGVSNNVDLFDPTFAFSEQHAKLDQGERRKLGPTDPRGAGEKLIDNIEWQKRSREGWGRYIEQQIGQKQVTGPDGKLKRIRFMVPPRPGQEAQARPTDMIEIPVTLLQALRIYRRYMSPEFEPVVRYAQNISAKAIEKGREEHLFGAIAGAQRAGKTSIPLDKDWTTVVGAVQGKDEAQAVYFSGKPPVDPATGKPKKEVLFLDLDTAIGEDMFKDRTSGVVTDAARELIQRVDQQRRRARTSLEYRKVVMFSSSTLKAEKMGGPNATLGGVKYHEMAKPDSQEVEHLIIPEKLEAFFGRGLFKATRGGKPVELYKTGPAQGGGTQLEPTPEYYQLLKEMSRYAGGFTQRGLNEYLTDVFHKTGKKPVAGLVGAANTIDIDLLLKWMRDNYVGSLFTSYGDANGAAVKDQFMAVDVNTVKPNGMRNPAKVEEYLRNVKRTMAIGQIVGDETMFEIKQLKAALEILKQRGIDIDPMSFDIFSTRYKKGPDGKPLMGPDGKPVPINPKISPESKVWDELTDADLESVRKVMANTLKQKIGNFLLLSGPGGTGKTSTAAYLADALGYGFMIWNMCRSKNMWVGETEKRAELAFKFICNLRDYVILLDEVDFCLGGQGGGGGQSHSSDQAVAAAFRTNWKLVEDAAPKNNLIIVSTTNYVDKIDPPTLRRLDAGGHIEIAYLKDMDDLMDIAGIVIDRYKASPGYPAFAKLKSVFGQALYREANTPSKGPYSNYEIDLLFKGYLAYNERVVQELGEGMAYDDNVLRYMVQNSERQSTSGRGVFTLAEPPIEQLKSGTLGAETPPGAATNVSVPGFSPVGPGQPPASGQPQLPPHMQHGPKARDVNLPQQQQQAEDYLVEEAPKSPPRRWKQNPPTAEILQRNVKMAALETPQRPMVKLLAVADNAIDQAHGLKYVKAMEPMTGMLFKFQSPKVLSFWMQDTYLSLDIAFIDHQGLIVKTERMIPMSTRSVTSGRPCVMALEVPAGTLEKLGAKVGKKVKIDLENKTVSIDD